MGQRGFSLIELVVILAVMVILMTAGTLQFNRYTQKAGIEREARTIYATLMDARAQALLQKTDRSVSVAAAQVAVFPTPNATGTPLRVEDLPYPITFDNAVRIYFDNRGVSDTDKIICIGPVGNPAYIDSIIITGTMIQYGKWNGGNCESGNITRR